MLIWGFFWGVFRGLVKGRMWYSFEICGFVWREC